MKKHLNGRHGISISKIAILLGGFLCCSFPVHTQFERHLPRVDWPGLRESKTPPKPDYSNLSHWAAHPYIPDNSDTIPLPKRAKAQVKILPSDTTLADVFFIYPTLYKREGKAPYFWNADVNDDSLNREIDESTIRFQASIFNAAGRVFAPRYRQAHLKAFFTTDASTSKQAFDTAFHDVCMAFEYYLKHFNQGRPFILAGHSQGSLHGAYLIKKYLDGTPLINKLIAAYFPGMALPLDSFKTIGACLEPSQTACITSWATYAHHAIPEWNFEGCIMVNPLSWTTSKEPVKANQNPGGTLWDFRIRPKLIDAQIANDVLRVHKPKHPVAWLSRMKNYHIADLNFFYLSIRNNAHSRVQSWWKEKQ